MSGAGEAGAKGPRHSLLNGRRVEKAYQATLARENPLAREWIKHQFGEADFDNPEKLDVRLESYVQALYERCPNERSQAKLYDRAKHAVLAGQRNHRRLHKCLTKM